MTDTQGATPQDAYRALRRSGSLAADPAQELAVEKLQTLHHRLRRYRPAVAANGWVRRLRLRREEPPPQGLYLYGGVGRGKTMLMDLFFEGAPVERKRRAHFHAFMLDVHERIHRFRQTPAAARDGDDPIPPVARALAEQAWLLCFDEFEVRDIADAMILGRLFTQLFGLGVVVIATSNRAPDRLYEGGLNRELFLPFIALLKEQLDVLHLAGSVDYRSDRMRGLPIYLTPLGTEATARLDRIFETLTDSARGEPDLIALKGRKLEVPQQAHGVARFTFAALCGRPLGAADYLALAERYHTLILDGIPQLAPERRNEARRFATLVDVLYDKQVRLVCAAAVPPEQLYLSGDGRFEFDRTVSRLNEMQSEAYFHRPRP